MQLVQSHLVVYVLLFPWGSFYHLALAHPALRPFFHGLVHVEEAKRLRGRGTTSREGDERDKPVMPQGPFGAEAGAAGLDACLTFPDVARGLGDEK